MKSLVTASNADGKIRLRFSYNKKQHSWNLKEHYTNENLQKVSSLIAWIESDLKTGQLDISKSKYGLSKEILVSNNVQVQLSKNMSSVDFIRHFENWTKNIRQKNIDLDCDYRATHIILKRWNTFTTDQVIELLGKEKWSVKTYNKRLGMLKAFTHWLHKTKLLEVDFLDDVKTKRETESDNPDKDENIGLRDPFTNNDVIKILDSFYNNTHCSNHAQPKHSYYYPFVYFIFRLGVRNAEAVGLKIKDLDFNNNIIHIKRSLPRQYVYKTDTNGDQKVIYARKEKTPKKGSVNKNSQRKILLTPDVKELLVPIIKNRSQNDLVFTSPRSKGAISDANFQKRIFYKVLAALNIPRRNLYACRHTLITRSIQGGHSIAMLAQQVGNSPKMIESVYLHEMQNIQDFPMWK